MIEHKNLRHVSHGDAFAISLSPKQFPSPGAWLSKFLEIGLLECTREEEGGCDAEVVECRLYS